MTISSRIHQPVQGLIRRSVLIPLFLLLSVLFSTTAMSHGTDTGTISISHPWLRAVPVAGMNGAGYMEIRNHGEMADRLLEVSVDWAKKAEIHETSEENGMMSMKPLVEGVEIPAGQTVKLQPAGIHIMLMKIERALQPGERLPVTFRFENAGSVETFLVVQSMSGDSHEHH